MIIVIQVISIQDRQSFYKLKFTLNSAGYYGALTINLI